MKNLINFENFKELRRFFTAAIVVLTLSFTLQNSYAQIACTPIVGSYNSTGPTSTTVIDIASNAGACASPTTGHDQIQVSGSPGTADISGSTLQVNLLSGYNPTASPATTYTILTSTGGITGTFGVLNLPPLSSGFGWTVSYTSSAIVLSICSQHTITLTSAAGTNNQIKCSNAVAGLTTGLDNIVYNVTGPTGVSATVSGLPSGVTSSFNAGTGDLTISQSGTIAPGIYNYTVTTVNPTNATCPTATATGTITVKAAPSGTIPGAANVEICAGNSGSVNVQLTGTPSFSGTFKLTPIAGSGTASTYSFSNVLTSGSSAITIPAANLTNTSTSPVTYKLEWDNPTSLSDNTGCAPVPGTLTGFVNILVNPSPNASILASTNKVCEGATGATITLTGSVGPVPYQFTYTTSINGGAAVTSNVTTSGSSPSHIINQPTSTPGTYNYTITNIIDNKGCSPQTPLSGITTCVVVFPTPTTLIAPANTCNAAFTLPTVTPPAGFVNAWSIDEGPFTTSPTIPTTPGCHTIQHTYATAAACGSIVANSIPDASSTCEASNEVSVLIFPAAPVLAAISNTCNSALSVTALPAVTGFTAEYAVSVNGGTYTAWSTTVPSPSAPGCYAIKARYVGDNCAPSLTAPVVPPVVCEESAPVSALVFPATPVLAAITNTCNSALSVTPLPAVTGFTAEYAVSANGGTYTAWSSTVPSPSAPGCYAIKARYVGDNCAPLLTAPIVAPAACEESVPVNAIVFPSAPTITNPSNVCATAFTLPTVTPVTGFTIEYSIDGGAFSSSPVIPTSIGCHKVVARYVSNICGTIAAGTTAPAACAESNDANVVIFPEAPVLPNTITPTCGAMFTLPTPSVTLPSGSGFTLQYSIDNGVTWSTNPSTTTPGCYTVYARYVTSAACGTSGTIIPAGTVAPGTLAPAPIASPNQCFASNAVDALIYPNAPVLTPVSSTECANAFTLPSVAPVPNFTVQYKVINTSTSTTVANWLEASAITIPSTAGCYSIQARYVNSAVCGTTAALTTNPSLCNESAIVHRVIYPNAPVITATANTCNTMFALPTVTPITGFNVEYSIDGGAFSAAPSTTTPGCHTVKARYVLAAECGSAITSGSASTVAACIESNTVSVTIYPNAPTISAPANSCNSMFTLPAVASVAGFNVEYAIRNNSVSSPSFTAWSSNPSSTVPGCYTVKARYVLAAACGSTTVTTSPPSACAESNEVNTVIFPASPGAFTVFNVCSGTNFTIPAIAAVDGFTAEYNVNNTGWGTLASAQSATPTAAGCYTIQARYALTVSCGSTAAGTASSSSACAPTSTSALVYPTAPVLTATSNVCSPTVLSLPSVTSVSGFTTQFEITQNGTVIKPFTDPMPSPMPSAAACYGVKARYVNTNACAGTAPLTPGPAASCQASAEVFTTILPAAPAAPTITSNLSSQFTCSNNLTVTAPPAVTGFSAEYSSDNGVTWQTSNTFSGLADNCAGYQFKVRYVRSSACGSTAAGSGLSCSESPATTRIVDMTAPTWTTPAGSLNTTVSCNNISTMSAAQALFPVATDNCDNDVTNIIKNAGAVPANTSGIWVNPATANNIYTFPTGSCTFPKTVTNTWTVTDDCGNTSSAFTQVITIVDNIPPFITGTLSPVSLNVGAGTNCQVPIPDYRALVATVVNECSDYKIEQLAPNAPGSLVIGTGGTVTVNFLITDACGNSNTTSLVVNLADQTAPNIVCRPSPVVVNLSASGTATITPSMIDNGTTDNCSTPTLSLDITSFNCSNLGNNLVTLTAVDAAGNIAQCQTTVLVKDVTAPTITCPADITVTKGTTCTNEMQDYTGLAITSDACGPVTVTQLIPVTTSIGANVSSVVQTLIATDGSGNSSTCSFTIFYKDLTPPTLVNCPSNITVNTDAGNPNCSQTATWTPPTATDNCTVLGAPTISSTHNPGTTFPVGTTTVTYTATDAAGNTSSCSFTVTVVDNTAPIITCNQTNVNTVAASGLCSANVTGLLAPTFSDNCTATLSHTITGATTKPATTGALSSHTFNVGTSTVTYTVSDASNNFALCSYTVTVTDNQAPSVTAPANITSVADPGLCTAQVNGLGTPITSDNCGIASTTNNAPSGLVFPVGTTTVVWTVVDVNGNTATANQTITVTDNQLPDITGCPAAITVSTGAGNTSCTTTASWTAPIANDNCGIASFIPKVTASPNAALIGVTAVSGTTQFPVGTSTIVYTATDVNGNTSTCSFTVTVVDDTKPIFTGCPSNITVNTGVLNANCSQVVNWVAPVASDNCTALPTVVSTHNAGSAFPVGTTTVTYTATDAAGNTNTCTFNVTVVDNTVPVITDCPSNITVSSNSANSASCSQLVNWTAPTATDNCTASPTFVATFTASNNSSVAVGSTATPGASLPVGTYTVTYKATDAAGNSSTCAFNITVVDDTKPMFTAMPSNVTAVPNTSGCAYVTTVPSVSATDNCAVSSAGVSYTITGALTGSGTAPITGTINFPVGVTTITYNVTDVNGNTNTYSYTVTVTNSLNGDISGTATVVQDVSTTSNITFSASGGVAPYTFTYQVSNNNGASYGPVQTISTTGTNTIVTVPQSNAVVGNYVYQLLSVVDANGCSGTLPADPRDTISVVNSVVRPELGVTIDRPLSTSFATAGQVREGFIQITNVSSAPTTGPVVMTVIRPSNFNMLIPTTMTVVNSTGSFTVNNSSFDIVSLGSLGFIITTKPGVIISGNSNLRLGFTLTRTGESGSVGNLQATIDNYTGGSTPTSTGNGDVNVSNNSSVKLFVNQ